MENSLMQDIMCKECYTNQSRITPLLNPMDCLTYHTQYICGTCGRCICIEHDSERNLQRWNFPFRSLEIAKLYLRTADYTMKKSCGIYEIKDRKGRCSYKIFANKEDLDLYLKKNQGKTCSTMTPLFRIEEYKEFANTQVRRLTDDEVSNISQSDTAPLYKYHLKQNKVILFYRTANSRKIHTCNNLIV